MENDRKISEAAEAARKGVGSVDLTMEAEQTAYLSNSNIAVTDTNSKYVWNNNPKAKIVALYVGRGTGTRTYSLTHSLTHSYSPYSLTYSHTHLLIHSLLLTLLTYLTYSLTHSLIH